MKVIRKDLLSWLKQGNQDDNQSFSIVYFDPPYQADLYRPALELLRVGGWVQPKGLVICEHTTQKPLNVPAGWREVDRRRYGSSSLLFISLPGRCRGDTDSTPQQTSQEV